MSNGADTGKGFAQRFLFGQPEASNGADTSRDSHSDSSSDSRRQITEQTLVRNAHSGSSSDSLR